MYKTLNNRPKTENAADKRKQEELNFDLENVSQGHSVRFLQ